MGHAREHNIGTEVTHEAGNQEEQVLSGIIPFPDLQALQPEWEEGLPEEDDDE